MKVVYCFDEQFLPILYPDFRIQLEGDYVHKGCLFMGRGRPKGHDSALFFVRNHVSEIDISVANRAALVSLAYSRKARIAPKSMAAYVEKLPLNLFKEELKHFMATGKWEKVESNDMQAYELFFALRESRESFLKVYFKLRERLPYQVIWSYVLSFFGRVAEFDPKNSRFTKSYNDLLYSSKKNLSKYKMAFYFIDGDMEFNEASFVSFLLSVR